MAAQREGNPEHRSQDTPSETLDHERGRDRATDVEAIYVQPEPWSEGDPLRANRIAEARSQTDSFLEEIRATGNGYGDLPPGQYRRLSEDAQERARWTKARSDAFRGILRLGIGTPSRFKRVL